MKTDSRNQIPKTQHILNVWLQDFGIWGLKFVYVYPKGNGKEQIFQPNIPYQYLGDRIPPSMHINGFLMFGLRSEHLTNVSEIRWKNFI